MWVAALTPLSVDGMIVAASTTLLADLRRTDHARGKPVVCVAPSCSHVGGHSPKGTKSSRH